MRKPIAIVLVLALIAVLAAACGDDGESAPTPAGPTTLSFEKTVVGTGQGEFRFTLTLTNAGGNAAVNVATSDVWQEGLEVTAIGAVEGQQPKAIGKIGLEFILKEMAAGKSVELVYTARCIQSGEWQNTAVSGAQNAEPAEATVTVTCP